MTEDNTVVKPMEHTQKMAEERYPEGQNLHMAYRQSYIQAIKDAFEDPTPFGLATLGAYQYEKIHKEVAEGLLEEKDRELARLSAEAEQSLLLYNNMTATIVKKDEEIERLKEQIDRYEVII